MASTLLDDVDFSEYAQSPTQAKSSKANQEPVTKPTTWEEFTAPRALQSGLTWEEFLRFPDGHADGVYKSLVGFVASHRKEDLFPSDSLSTDAESHPYFDRDSWLLRMKLGTYRVPVRFPSELATLHSVQHLYKQAHISHVISDKHVIGVWLGYGTNRQVFSSKYMKGTAQKVFCSSSSGFDNHVCEVGMRSVSDGNPMSKPLRSAKKIIEGFEGGILVPTTNSLTSVLDQVSDNRQKVVSQAASLPYPLMLCKGCPLAEYDTGKKAIPCKTYSTGYVLVCGHVIEIAIPNDQMRHKQGDFQHVKDILDLGGDDMRLGLVVNKQRELEKSLRQGFITQASYDQEMATLSPYGLVRVDIEGDYLKFSVVPHFGVSLEDETHLVGYSEKALQRLQRQTDAFRWVFPQMWYPQVTQSWVEEQGYTFPSYEKPTASSKEVENLRVITQAAPAKMLPPVDSDAAGDFPY